MLSAGGDRVQAFIAACRYPEIARPFGGFANHQSPLLFPVSLVNRGQARWSFEKVQEFFGTSVDVLRLLRSLRRAGGGQHGAGSR